jgi:hypothetical protein
MLMFVFHLTLCVGALYWCVGWYRGSIPTFFTIPTQFAGQWYVIAGIVHMVSTFKGYANRFSVGC